ncbi:hypothetical protein FLP10_07070 [Agromyces intestinalis]|uniref:N-acylglucosamine-6-phosphate 2-epimerase n=1 Tax=Agromyces intestinalis TaxID=2592652 RepID=A0A5C1YDS4_9MICO|nr:hypothetical protein [Agromyces intestinalis]QEO14204.1 hypothetical protein FLP10_07070 [Agromyces intestinalis]
MLIPTEVADRRIGRGRPAEDAHHAAGDRQVRRTEPFRRGLVVSLLPTPTSPWSRPDDIARLAIAADAGGAVAVRVGSATAVRAVRMTVPGLPIIARHTSPDGFDLVAGVDEIAAMGLSGADLVEIDVDDAASLALVSQATFDGFRIAARVDRRRLATAAVDAGAGAIVFAPPVRGGAGAPVIHALLDAVGAATPTIVDHDADAPEVAAASLRLGAHGVVIGAGITDPMRLTWTYATALTGIAAEDPQDANEGHAVEAR